MPRDTQAPTRPGERLIAGRVAIQDLDLLNLHVAHEAVLSAPADLSGLDYEALVTLVHAANSVVAAPRSLAMGLPYPLDREAADALAFRASEERATRPEYRRVYCPEMPEARASGRRAAA
jgi:hypothetical protein